VRDRVAAAFAARQALQRAELEQLRQRFTRIERQIDSRDRIQDEIIEHRVKELIDPNLQWAPEGPPATGAASGSEAPLASSEAGSLERVQALEAAADAEQAPSRKTELLSQAAAAYEQIYLKHRSQVLGLYARLYQARCLEKLGKAEQAAAIYSQLGWKPDGPATKPSQREHELREQLLRIDLEAARLRVEGAKALLAEAESVRAKSPAAVSESSIAERRVALQQAELEVRRAETLLEAHRAQDDTDRPQLERPDSAAHINEADLAKLTWALLGLKLEPIDRQPIETGPYRGGLTVLEVRHNGPAHQAGLRVADILVGLHTWETISNDNLAFVLQRAVLRDEEAASSGLKAYVLRDGAVLMTTLSPDRRGVSSGRSEAPEVGR
jgi:hypothetical protein